MLADAMDKVVWRVPALMWVALAMMLGGAWLGDRLTPRHYVADDKPAVVLDKMVPSEFGGWRVDPSQATLLVDPNLKKAIDALYTQTLNRLYVGPAGERVLLSIAYGRNQNSESTAAHRPEFCYSAQGFVVARLGVTPVNLTGHQIAAVRLDATSGERREPISYWVTLNDEPTLPGWQRKLRQITYGIRGDIVDGMLVRVSTLRSARDPGGLDQEFAQQDRFLQALEGAMTAQDRVRFFGK